MVLVLPQEDFLVPTQSNWVVHRYPSLVLCVHSYIILYVCVRARACVCVVVGVQVGPWVPTHLSVKANVQCVKLTQHAKARGVDHCGACLKKSIIIVRLI